MKSFFLPVALLAALAPGQVLRAEPTPTATPAALQPAQPAPGFTLPDVDSKPHTLAEYRGQPLALYFFCGCEWCHKVGSEWGKMQRSGVLNSMAPPGKPAPLTVIVFDGDAGNARLLAQETQLDLKRTILLTDQNAKTTELYQVDPCPRVFVLDAQGIFRYTNNEKGKDSARIPAPLIVARTVDALRAVTAKPVANPAKTNKPGASPAPTKEAGKAPKKS